jgi:polyhydroxyalkanoate synthesis regulator phasin
MYNSAQQSPNVVEDQKPILKNIIDRFEKENAAQTELVNLIQERLHDVVNKREPSDPAGNKQAERPMDNSFSDAMNTQLFKMQSTTNRLEAILRHIQQIV